MYTFARVRVGVRDVRGRGGEVQWWRGEVTDGEMCSLVVLY